MNVSSPSEIYTSILDEVNNLIQSLKTETTDEEIRKSQEDAQKQLEGIHKEVHNSLLSLQKNAEWDVFCIAFYGETNAGKSTLIETLRILLREPTKEKERAEYKQVIDSIQGVQNQLKQGQYLVEQISKDFQPKIMELDSCIYANSIKQADIEKQIIQLKESAESFKIQITVKRKSALVNFFKAFFGKLNEQKEIRMIEKILLGYISDIANLNKEKLEIERLKKSLQEEWNTKSNDAEVSVARLQKKIEQISEKLYEYSDGKIIGDGHSDFTREITTYQLEYNGQKFALLDLPGIEGKENLVLDVINSAVQKAHAVFYISGKPTPPQKGEEGSGGTLGKIKKHLGQQTEVYSIFNKRIRNPQQVQPGLIDDDEKACLKELDIVMRESLGEQYDKHIVLSAYPAFLSVANCWQNDFEKGQKKFLENFSSKIDLLQVSLVQCFIDWLTTNLVSNCKEKIKKSNYKKVAVILRRTSGEINEIFESLRNLQEKLIKNKKSTDNQLDEVAEILHNQLNTEAIKSVDEFKTVLRRNIYSDIDKKISNDEFKSAFELRKDNAIDILSLNLAKNTKIVIADFKNEIESIVEKYHRNSSELLSAYKNAAHFDFDFKPTFEIKSGINWPGTITSIAGGIAGVILCLSNPAGWVVLALSIVGAVISIGKAILGFFDHTYRASQQKKTADDNIEKMADGIAESIMENLKAANQPLQEGIYEIKDELLKSVDHIKTMNQVFGSAGKKFKVLTTTIENEGVI